MGSRDAGRVTVASLSLTPPPWPPEGGRMLGASGETAQILNGDEFRFAAYLEFRPDGPNRANHYHLVKHESMYVIRGRLLGRYLDLESGDYAEVELVAGDMVAIPPRVAHTYVALERSDAIEFDKLVFDPSDVIPFVVEPM
jgi:quercetin dioxygenase-like cupin family protein